MVNNQVQQTTFWEFIKKYKIEIPIIQRDYAQGRIGNEKLREIFLSDLRNALDGKLINNERTLKLDFIYGNIDNGCLNPLDGQQRLTTLWLLHWYIAFKAGKLVENRDILMNFSYETRISSREFCKQLSVFDKASSDSIIEIIEQQTWFYTSWKQDPTIRAMLNMLCGTPIKDNKNNDILDGIEEVFKDCDYINYWEQLVSKECPIIFYYLDLEDLSLSDDLYIKMNARGKSLTNFENFKADLIGFINENEFDKGKNPDETIAYKLDVIWLDIFWKYRSVENKLDDIYFAFLNRYFLNNLLTSKDVDGAYLFTQKKIESNNPLFDYLYGESGDDSKIKYYNFEIYRSEQRSFDKQLFECLERTLDNFYVAFRDFSVEDINRLFFPSWNINSNFRFIPEYVENTMVQYSHYSSPYISSTLTLPQRVIFFAVCCYFENNKYCENTFNQWMRVIWNIVENANIETIPSMIGAIRLVDELKPHANRIYCYLADSKVVIKSEIAKEQVAEEIEKAKQIWNDQQSNWEGKIVESEKTAFFKGAIRFLFRTNIEIYDWNIFQDRFVKAKMFFTKDGVNEPYKKDAYLLRVLISKFTEFGHFTGEIFDNNSSSWRTILLDEKLVVGINQLFDLADIFAIDLNNFSSSIIDNERLRDFQNDLCKSTILNWVSPKSYFHWCNHDKYSLFPYKAKSQSKIFVLADKRNEIMSGLDGKIIDIDDGQRVEGLPYYKGWDLHFTLKSNNQKYKWFDSLQELTEINEWREIPDVSLDNLETYLTNVPLPKE
ncbi:MAG TPA: DUF262 domain-containing protein [Candidatus Cloacimonadota bacterium]|nr:DUF262 domain-containing protein [Candidatus Cloacimonadota bacterium]